MIHKPKLHLIVGHGIKEVDCEEIPEDEWIEAFENFKAGGFQAVQDWIKDNRTINMVLQRHAPN